MSASLGASAAGRKRGRLVQSESQPNFVSASSVAKRSSSGLLPPPASPNEQILWEEDSSDPFLPSSTICGRGLLDGCTSLEEVIIRLKQEASRLEQLLDDGYELKAAVQNDMAVLTFPEEE